MKHTKYKKVSLAEFQGLQTKDKQEAYTNIKSTKIVAANLYKTSLCRNKSPCKYGDKCMYAHSESELRKPICAFGKSCTTRNDRINPCKFSHEENFDSEVGKRMLMDIKERAESRQQKDMEYLKDEECEFFSQKSKSTGQSFVIVFGEEKAEEKEAEEDLKQLEKQMKSLKLSSTPDIFDYIEIASIMQVCNQTAKYFKWDEVPFSGIEEAKRLLTISMQKV